MDCGRETYYLRSGKVVQMFRLGRAKELRCPCGSQRLYLFYH